MNPTASGLERAEHCAASCAFPQITTSSDRADWGTSSHRFLRLVAAGLELPAALEQIPEEHRTYCASIDLEGLPLDPAQYHHELALAYDVHTGRARILGQDLGRAYVDLTPTEIAGTPDVFGLDGEHVTLVEDYKFSSSYDCYAPPPGRNLQLAFGAVCGTALHRGDRARVRIITFDDDGDWTAESAELDEFDCEACAGRFSRILASVRAAEAAVAAGRTPDVHRGPWCHYCPAVQSCPAVAGLIRAFAADPAAAAEDIRRAITSKSAGAAYRRVKEAQAVLGMVSSALYAYSMEQPIDLGDGEWFGPKRAPKDDIDPEKAYETVTHLHGPDVALKSMTLATTKAGLKRGLELAHAAALKAGTKVSKKSLLDGALAAIDKAGGIKHGTRVTVKAYRLHADEETPQASPSPRDPPPPGDEDQPPPVGFEGIDCTQL